MQRDQGMPRRLETGHAQEAGVYPSMAPMGRGTTCSISVPYKDFIYVQTGNSDEWDKGVVAPKAPSLICLDKRTGKLIWSDNSPGKDILDGQFASPLVVEIAGQAQVIVPMGDGWLRSFDALTGKMLWKFDANPKAVLRGPESKYWNNLLATPVCYEQRIYFATGNCRDHHTIRPRGGFIASIPPKGNISFEIVGAAGKIELNPNSGLIWRFGSVGGEKKGPAAFYGSLGNFAIHDGLAHCPDFAGYVNCLDARTGQLHWKHDVRAEIMGTPLIVDGKVYVNCEDGMVRLFNLSKEKSVLGEIDMDDSLFVSPIFANGVLFLGTRTRLYAIAGAEKSPAKTVGFYWPQISRDQTRGNRPRKSPPLWWQAAEEGIPARNILWTAPLGRFSWGDPVVVAGRIWVGTGREHSAPDG